MAAGLFALEPSMKTVGEYMTRKGAEKLAGKVRGYWLDRGHYVNVYVEQIDRGDEYGKPVFAIRSDLVDGLPRVATRIPLAA